MKELYVALVMREQMKDTQGASPDLAFVEADSFENASKAISSYKPNHPRMQEKTITRIVMLDSLENYLKRKFVTVAAGEVQQPATRRRRVKDDDHERRRGVDREAGSVYRTPRRVRK